MEMWIRIGSLLMALAVALSAFAAHGLKGTLTPYGLEVFEKAAFYNFIHALAILMLPILARLSFLSEQSAGRACLMFAGGIFFFSGSLYLLALSQIKWLGAITPIGGVLFIAAWIYLAFSVRVGR